MAITAISSADQARLRGKQYPPRVKLYTIKPQVVATATITSLPELVPYRQLGVGSTSGWSSIENGMLIKIHDGDDTRAYATIIDSDTNTLDISLTYTGAPGYPQQIRVPIEVGDTVTVYKHFPLWGLYPTIEDDEFIKYGGRLGYIDQNASPPPIANAGPPQVAEISVGGSAQFTLPKGGSNTSFVFPGGGALADSYQWTVPTGVTIDMGSSATNPVISVTATQGQHLIKFQFTDDNGKVNTSYTYLIVDDGANYTALSQDYQLTELSATRDSEGQTLEATFVGSDIDLLPGAMVILKEWPVFEGGALAADVYCDTFVGYISEMSFSHDGNIGTVSITAESPVKYAKHVVQLPQYVNARNDTPASWAEVIYSISSPFFALYYAIMWHTPNMMRMHDIDFGSAYTVPLVATHNYEGTSLYDAMSLAAQYLVGNVGNKADGTLCLRRNPLYQGNTYRNSLQTIITLTEADIRGGRSGGGVSWTKRIVSDVREARAGAFAWEGENTDAAWNAMYRWEQGTSFQQLPGSIVTKAEGLDEVKARAGHYLALLNAPFKELSLDLRDPMDVFEPASMTWVRYDYDPTFDPSGKGFDNVRALIDRVEIDWSLRNGRNITKDVTLVVKPESFGQPGEEWVPEGYDISTPPTTDPYDPDDDVPATMIAVNDQGDGVYTLRAQATTPQWHAFSAVNGVVADICLDFGSGYFAFGRSDKKTLGAYVVSQNGTSVHLYYIKDVLAAQYQFTPITTFTAADTTGTNNARVECSYTAPEYVAVAIKDATGVKVARSSNYGASFGTLTQIGSSITDAAYNDNAPIGMAWDFDYLYITGPNASNLYGVYIAQGTGSFSAVGSSPRRPSPVSAIAVAGDSSIIVSFANYQTLTYNLPFPDESNDLVCTRTDESTLGGNVEAYEDSSGGDPDDNIRFQPSADPPGTANPDARISVATPMGTTFKRALVDVWATNGAFDAGLIYLWWSSGPSNDVFAEWGDAAASETELPENVWQTIGIPRSAYSSNNISINITMASYAGGIQQTNDTAQIIRFDNFYIEMWEGVPAIMRCADPTGSPSWSNISPFVGSYCQFPHGISVDRVDGDRVDVLVYNEDTETTRWYTSSNLGSAWTQTDDDTAFRFIRSSGDFIVAAGEDVVVTNTIEGGAAQDRTGNLGTIVDDIGIIKRVVYP